MEDKIKIATAIAPVIIQNNFNAGRTILADGEIIASEINIFTNKLLAKLHRTNQQEHETSPSREIRSSAS